MDAQQELANIRAMMLVNFSKGAERNTTGIFVTEDMSTNSMVVHVLEHYMTANALIVQFACDMLDDDDSDKLDGEEG